MRVSKTHYNLISPAKIRNLFILHDTEKLVHAFITSNLDYLNRVLPLCLIKGHSDGSERDQSSLLRLIQATLNVY